MKGVMGICFQIKLLASSLIFFQKNEFCKLSVRLYLSYFRINKSVWFAAVNGNEYFLIFMNKRLLQGFSEGQGKLFGKRGESERLF